MRAKWLSILLLLSLVVAGCSPQGAPPVTAPPPPASPAVRVGVYLAAWNNAWAWEKWPGGPLAWIRDSDNEIRELGCTVKIVDGNGALIGAEIAEARRHGLRLIVCQENLKYRGDGSAWLEVVKSPLDWRDLALVNANVDVVDGVWVADDQYTDSDYASDFRARLRALLDPRVRIIISSNDWLRLYREKRGPLGDLVVGQVYPWWCGAPHAGLRVPEEDVRAAVLRQLAEIASDNSVQPGIWVQGFGCSIPDDAPLPLRGPAPGTWNYNYWPPAGELLWQMNAAREAGFRDIYIFTGTWWSTPGDPWTGVWDHQEMLKALAAGKPGPEVWRIGGTRLRDEVKAFTDSLEWEGDKNAGQTR